MGRQRGVRGCPAVRRRARGGLVIPAVSGAALCLAPSLRICGAARDPPPARFAFVLRWPARSAGRAGGMVRQRWAVGRCLAPMRRVTCSAGTVRRVTAVPRSR